MTKEKLSKKQHKEIAMIRIQKLKEPKKTSGLRLKPQETLLFRGVHITNNNKYDMYVDWYLRKPWKRPKEKK